MGSHVALRRRRWFGQGRTRALLTLGAVGVLATTATSAYWTDTATVSSGSIVSGSMDMQLRTPTDATWRHVGYDSTTSTDTQLAISDLTPGESKAFAFGVRNVGNPNFNYVATVKTGTTWTFSGNPIQVRFFVGGTVTNGSTYPRSGACSSGSALGSGPVTVTGTAAIVIPSRTLAGGLNTTNGGTEQLCAVVSMASSADNANQSKSGVLELRFAATQATT